jgi:two-component system OmpR family response regulator
MIEDDAELAEVLTQYLARFNISVTNYEDPFLALSQIALNDFELIILDLTLPGLDGLEVCKKLVERSEIPIIISSARSDITDKVIALELGADDYLPKPYDPRELEVRIKTILRRLERSNQNTQENEQKELFVLDEERQEIRKENKLIKFTPAEYEVFSLLCKRKGFIVSRYDILDESEHLGNGDDGGSMAVIINRIRAKIEDNPKEPKHLQTIRGMGYKLVE